MAYLMEVFANRKRVLPMKDVVPANMPRYLEFTVNACKKMFKSDTIVMQFLPDISMKKRSFDRTFVFNVLIYER